MSKKVTFELNREGVAELLKGPEMEKILSEVGETVKEQCGGFGNVSSEEYVTKTQVRGTRVVTTVAADTPHAYYSNLKHNTLVKALRSIKRE